MIKFVARWVFRSIILGIVLLVALILLRDQILRSILERKLRASTGADVKLGSVQTGLMNPTITIENLVLYNTPEFGGGPFLDVPELHLEYAADARGRGDLKFKVVRLNLRELSIVESLRGTTNLVDMTASLEKTQRPGDTNAILQFHGIDTLNLSVGQIRYINMRRPARNQNFNLALRNEIVQNVRTWNDMASLVFKILLRAGITIYLDNNLPQASRTNNPVPVHAPAPAPVQAPAPVRR